MAGAVTRLFTGFVTVLGPALIFWLGATEYLGGRLTIGQLFAFNAYLAYLMGSANGLVSIHMSVQSLCVALHRMFEILDIPNERTAPLVSLQSPGRACDIEFSGVSFAYHPETPVLSGINLRIGAGQLAAFVGASGAGKSTLTALLLRLYDSYEGRIELGGVEIRTVDPALLRRTIALVPQESNIVNGTIAENIRYDGSAPDEEVRQAAIAACCDDFISQLPDGYETMLGENGFNVSTGQRQRIAIARALLRHPRVLILDEATSGLDAGSELRIREALDKLRGVMTCIVVAHRLYTVTQADRIFFLEDGEVQSEGTHTELFARCPAYAELFQKQFQFECVGR
jgi:ATP-binding cassette subfamily B protein